MSPEAANLAAARCPITVGILTRNNETTLPAALESVERVDELLVADGRSTDATVSVAEAFGARVIQQDASLLDSEGRLVDIAGARQQMLAAARNDMIFFLDSDEAATPELLDEISRICAAGDTGVAIWKVPRKYVLDGRVIDHAMNYPSTQGRLVDRRGISGYDGIVHDVPVARGGWATASLDAAQLVPLPPLRELVRRWHKYLKLEEIKHADLDRAGWVANLLRPSLRVVRWYLYRLVKVHARPRPATIPLRYDVARIGYVALVPVYTGRRFLGWRSGALDRAWD